MFILVQEVGKLQPGAMWRQTEVLQQSNFVHIEH